MFNSLLGFGRINIQGWSERINDEIIDGLIGAGTKFYDGSGASHCWDPYVQCVTQYFTEMNQLLSSGYTFWGNDLLPPQ